MSHPATPSHFIGCDVGKPQSSSRRRRRPHPNDRQRAAGPIRLHRLAQSGLLVVCEATGGYERDLLAALAGLAPHPNQSGQTDAYRRTRGGRPEVKRVLFMAAISAAKHNPTRSAFYKRLLSAGKKPLVAITAIMRKLVVIANAKLKTTNALQLS